MARCYSQVEIFCKKTAFAALLGESIWVLLAGKMNDAARAERRACHTSCGCRHLMVVCSVHDHLLVACCLVLSELSSCKNPMVMSVTRAVMVVIITRFLVLRVKALLSSDCSISSSG